MLAKLTEREELHQRVQNSTLNDEDLIVNVSHFFCLKDRKVIPNVEML